MKGSYETTHQERVVDVVSYYRVHELGIRNESKVSVIQVWCRYKNKDRWLPRARVGDQER